MKKEEKVKQNLEEDESAGLNIEDLIEIQGGIEDERKNAPDKSCGLGCFQGSGGFNSPNN